MNGHQYEHECAKRLKKSGFNNVNVTKGSGDQGIDVIAYKNGEKYGIQCKYYSSPVGNSAVQEAFAGAKYYNCQYAVVLTNNTFTQSARDLAKRTNVLLWGNDKIPASVGQSQIIKWLGIIMLCIGVLGLFVMRSINDLKYPISQRIYMILLIIGGISNLIEYNQYAMDLISCICYLIAAIINGIINLISSGSFSNGTFLFIIAFLISLARCIKLYAKMIQNSKKGIIL